MKSARIFAIQNAIKKVEYWCTEAFMLDMIDRPTLKQWDEWRYANYKRDVSIRKYKELKG